MRKKLYGKDNPAYVDGKTLVNNKCKDCGKKISINAKRCKSCAKKGNLNLSFKHGFKIRDPKKRKHKFCVDCGAKIDNTAIRCISCSNTHRSGEKSSTWKGGVNAEGYVTSEFNDKLKKHIRERDNHTCQECGREHIKTKKAFDVHHMDYDKMHNTPSNLITLCNKCHTKTSLKDREYWYVHFMCKLNKQDHWLKVTWEDACNYSNESLDNMKEKEAELVDTFGKIVLYNTKYCIIMTHDSRGESNDYIRIPISLLRKVEI